MMSNLIRCIMTITQSNLNQKDSDPNFLSLSNVFRTYKTFYRPFSLKFLCLSILIKIDDMGSSWCQKKTVIVWQRKPSVKVCALFLKLLINSFCHQWHISHDEFPQSIFHLKRKMTEIFRQCSFKRCSFVSDM